MRVLASQEIKVGFRVRVLAGQEFVDADGVEYYKEGDIGTIAAAFGHVIRIAWHRTGRTSSLPKTSWSKYVHVCLQDPFAGVSAADFETARAGYSATMTDALRVVCGREVPLLGDRVVALPGQVCKNEKGRDVFVEYDVGTVCAVSSIEVTIAWERTGRTHSFRLASWLKYITVTGCGESTVAGGDFFQDVGVGKMADWANQQLTRLAPMFSRSCGNELGEPAARPRARCRKVFGV